MEFTEIPNINAKISRIGLGTWSIGGSLWGGSDEEASIQAIHQALDSGINLLDTAPGYGNGASEEIIGRALKKYGKRDKLILATKFGLNLETQNVFRDSRRESILKELEKSLKRLQVDYIDIYQVHWPDNSTPLSETAETLNQLLKQGKIRAIGVSNFSLQQIQEFRKTAPIHVVQPPFNLFEQDFAKEILPYCQKEHIASLGYSALCRGLLSGKMTKDRKFQGDDLRGGMDPKFKEPRFSQYLECVKALDEWSQKKYQKPVIALAVHWVLDKGVSVALWGARKPEQLKAIDSIFGWKLTNSDFEEIQKIIKDKVKDPVGNEFMSPPERKEEAGAGAKK